MISAIIDLTVEQVHELKPLFTEVSAAAQLTAETKQEHRLAILGQAWSPDDIQAGGKAGCAKFYLLSTDQFKVVNKAIIKALKMDMKNDEHAD